jgi:hypothetical protein
VGLGVLWCVYAFFGGVGGGGGGGGGAGRFLCEHAGCLYMYVGEGGGGGIAHLVPEHPCQIVMIFARKVYLQSKSC